MKKIIILLSIIMSYSFGYIDIQPQVIGEKKGLDGEMSITASFSDGNSEERSIGTSIKGQYDAQEWIAIVIAAYNYGEANNHKSSEAGLLHLRYIHAIDEKNYDWEVFVQSEFNPFQKLKERSLVGVGLRKSFTNYFDKFYMGLGLMYTYREPDVITEFDKVLKRTKINSYISLKKTFSENLSIAYLGYYQPTVDDFSDFSSRQILQFITPLADSVNLSLNLIYKYNDTPYSSIEKDDFNAKLSLTYEF